MGLILRRLTTSGWKRGVLGGSRAWTTIGCVAIGLRVAGAVLRTRPERVRVAQLRPGDRLEIRARRP